MSSLARKPKVRLIDKTGLAFAPVSPVRKPDAWFRSETHLAWLRKQTCACGCGAKPATLTETVIEAAHVRTGTDGATGVKPSDFYALPLSLFCHRIQHSMSEWAFWRDRGETDPAGKALSYAQCSPCERTRKAAAAVVAGQDWRGAA